MHFNRLDFYEFSIGSKLEGFFYTKDNKIYRVLKTLVYKELFPNSRGDFVISIGNGNYITISKHKVECLIKRELGGYNERKRLKEPFSRYEVDREGKLFNYDNPEVPLCFTHNNKYMLREDNNASRYRYITNVELVARYFTYAYLYPNATNLDCGKVIHKISRYVPLTDLPFCPTGAVYVSTFNTRFVEGTITTDYEEELCGHFERIDEVVKPITTMDSGLNSVTRSYVLSERSFSKTFTQKVKEEKPKVKITMVNKTIYPITLVEKSFTKEGN